ncbi:MAG: dihydroneopterin aldolase [Flavobacterium sp.]|jgi:dihydroneopterin aldolase
MDLVFISGLEVTTTIGAYDWEQDIRQTLIIDLELICDINKVARHDDLKDAIDYAEISTSIEKYLQKSHFQLIETVAERIAERVLSEFNIRELTLTVSKPQAIENARNVGVKITRSQSE